MTSLQKIIRDATELFVVDEPEMNDLKKSTKSFLQNLKVALKKEKIIASIFIGGSFAKKTLVRQKNYDMDIFVRFSKKYQKENLSELLFKALKHLGTFTVIHGSRDYARFHTNPKIIYEVVPVLAITNPKEARNVTDLSYLHVQYLVPKLNSKIQRDITLAKAFLRAAHCYGAESHIRGFSGYSVELLVHHYKGFVPFIRAIAKAKTPLVIDSKKHFKDYKKIFLDLNAAKLQSPIILVDPTNAQRNALSSLSVDVLLKFQKYCKAFLQKPNLSFFELRAIDLLEKQKIFQNKGKETLLIELKTDKQAGAIAGSKFRKFFEHFTRELLKSAKITEHHFEYLQDDTARILFVGTSKKEIICTGPKLTYTDHVATFKKLHPRAIVKSGRLIATKKIPATLRGIAQEYFAHKTAEISSMDITGWKIAA